MSGEPNNRFQACVVGAGPAGLACALGLARGGIKTVLLAGPHRPTGEVRDQRTAALFGCSIDLLKNLDVFDGVREASTAIAGIRIIDDTDRMLCAPEVLFSAEDVGLDVFGYNVPQYDLVSSLRAQAEAFGDLLTVVETKAVVSVDLDGDAAVLKTAEGDVYFAPVVAAADGRKSVCREAAGIKRDTSHYVQSALACMFSHGRDHKEISTEFQRAAGPCTVVPMPGRRSSLVWVERTNVCTRLAEMTETRFRTTLETRLQGLLGSIGEISSRVVFPLSLVVATQMAKKRVALIGEAGHVIPPIGAQGLNLSLRDGAALVDLLCDANVAGEDLGSNTVMDRFHKARQFDIRSRAGAVDLLNRSLISNVEVLHLARGAGMHALTAIGPLRRMVIQQGLGPQSGLPRMMRKLETTMDGAGV